MTDHPKVRIRGLYKIFGDAPEAVLSDVLDGMSKTDLLAERNHVLGLQDINVDMQAGEITVVMGLSGSGKSTLIRHLNRLIEPTSGEILIDGEDVMKLSADGLRALRQTKMSMVFQKFALLPHRTVLEHAAMALQIRGANLLPHQTEAFSALDPLIRTDMQDLLLELQTELHKTIVFITHDLDEALKLADHLVILKDGAVVQQGEPQQILLNPADPYIEDFVSDINRARVLRVRSIMCPAEPDTPFSGDLEADDTLESVITISGGATAHCYRVLQDGELVGQLYMMDLVKALVPRLASGERSVF